MGSIVSYILFYHLCFMSGFLLARIYTYLRYRETTKVLHLFFPEIPMMQSLYYYLKAKLNKVIHRRINYIQDRADKSAEKYFADYENFCATYIKGQYPDKEVDAILLKGLKESAIAYYKVGYKDGWYKR